MSVLGEVLADQEFDQAFTGDPSLCVDLHHGGTTFADHREWLGEWRKLTLDLGFGFSRDDWQPPGAGGKPLSPDFADRVARAEARAILHVARAAEDDIKPPSRKPWPKGCKMRIWLGEPVYRDWFAFVEAGNWCGSLCGEGKILALEYREGRWLLVAEKASWIA